MHHSLTTYARPEEYGTDSHSSRHSKYIKKWQPAPLIGSPGDMST